MSYIWIWENEAFEMDAKTTNVKYDFYVTKRG